eukprot:6890154-Pyramimonas_sp.AAC.1
MEVEEQEESRKHTILSCVGSSRVGSTSRWLARTQCAGILSPGQEFQSISANLFSFHTFLFSCAVQDSTVSQLMLCALLLEPAFHRP